MFYLLIWFITGVAILVVVALAAYAERRFRQADARANDAETALAALQQAVDGVQPAPDCPDVEMCADASCHLVGTHLVIGGRHGRGST